MPYRIGSVLLIILAIFVIIASYQKTKTLQSDPAFPLEHLQSFPIQVLSSKADRKGKLFPNYVLTDIYTNTLPLDCAFPEIETKLSIALLDQLKLLKRRKQAKLHQVGDLSIDIDQLKTTIESLVYTRNNTPELLEQDLTAYQIKGNDGRGNVLFTGYYTPIVKVAALPNATYRYPLYSKPNRSDWAGALPTRSQIDGEGALLGKGLELAYAKSLADIYYMQLQGSGIIEYPDGTREYLSYTSTNGHSYRSVEKYLVSQKEYKIGDISVRGMKRFFKKYPELEETILFSNPSYVFFDRKRKRPHGAGHVPLTADYSIAVDKDFIPLGSTLLAAFPILDRKGDLIKHEYRILLAQDLGGAIRGSGHVDVYCGIGRKGQEKAMAMHHYGQLWLLLPKDSLQTKSRFSSLN